MELRRGQAITAHGGVSAGLGLLAAPTAPLWEARVL